ncbi:uncharacterized protein METZ01_LOCUS311304, partial [marine metagenome]
MKYEFEKKFLDKGILLTFAFNIRYW